MKKLLFSVTLFILISCGDKKNISENENALVELQAYEASQSEEESTKQFIEDYLSDVNSPDWKTTLPKYLQPNPEEFINEHSAFRTSFSNYKATIKHLVADGNEAIVWINITANYTAVYTFENSDYGDEIIKDVEAKNQALSWDETWYFDVVDERFGDKWGFLKDNHKVLEDLKASELP